MTLYICVRPHKDSIESIHGYFIRERDAELCCSYYNLTQQQTSADKWYVKALEEDKINYVKLLENVMSENHIKEQLEYFNRGK